MKKEMYEVFLSSLKIEFAEVSYQKYGSGDYIRSCMDITELSRQRLITFTSFGRFAQMVESFKEAAKRMVDEFNVYYLVDEEMGSIYFTAIWHLAKKDKDLHIERLRKKFSEKGEFLTIDPIED